MRKLTKISLPSWAYAMMPRSMRKIKRDKKGVTIVEFAILAPTFFLLLMGGFDLGYQIYVQALLDGSLQKVGRDYTLEENSNHGAINGIAYKLTEKLKPAVIDNGREFLYDIENYESFEAISRGEPFTDANNNGKRDKGECYVDTNNNNNYDAAGSTSLRTNSAASTVQKLNFAVIYDRIFPLYKMLGQEQRIVIRSSTILRRQPFDEYKGSSNTGTKEICK